MQQRRGPERKSEKLQGREEIHHRDFPIWQRGSRPDPSGQHSLDDGIYFVDDVRRDVPGQERPNREVSEGIPMTTFPNSSEDQDGSVDEEEEKKAELRKRNRFYGKRKCWAKYCWADKTNPDCHSHPLETLSSNRLKLMGKGETDPLVIRTGGTYHIVRIARYNGERLIRTVDFYTPIYQRIEGFHGSGIAGYVGLLNRLLLLSFYTFLLLGGLFIVPSIINFHRFRDSVSEYATNQTTVSMAVEREILDSFAWDPVFNLNGTEEAYYLATHSRISREKSQRNVASQLASYAVELLEGTGWMEASWMFLGQYADRIELARRSSLHNINGLMMDPFVYNLPLAFLCSVFAVIVVSLVVLIFSSGSSLKEDLKGQHSRAYPFCEVLFGSWPHGLQFEAGVENQKMTETSQLKILLTISEKGASKSKTLRQMAVLHLVRVGVWLLVGGFLGAFGYLLYMSVITWVPDNIRQLEVDLGRPSGTSSSGESTTWNEAKRLFFNFVPSIIITGFNFLIPTVLKFLVKFEDYSVKIELRITLVRTVLLQLASVAFLLLSIFQELKLVSDLPSPTLSENNAIGFKIKNITKTPCFETYIGQQIYKVLVLDMLVTVGIFIALRIPRKLAYKTTKIEFLRSEFDLSGNILSAIYIQCLYWLGIFYAPLLCGMAILHFLLKAIIGQLGIFYIFEPPRKIHHSSGSDVFFTVVALLSFFLALLALGFAMIKVQPSAVCGPFIYMQKYSTMYDFFMGTIIASTGKFKFFIEIGTSSVILFPVTVFIAVILYYKIATARAKAVGINILKKKIEDATGQKKFLERKARQLKIFS